MILVTQGHENGIGLEIFLKSFLLLSPEEKKGIKLFVNEQHLEKNLTDLKLPKSHFKELSTSFFSEHANEPASTTSLVRALESIKPNDILVTLPTSKDQLFFNQKNCAGYTEFFRRYYNNNNIAMTFKGIVENVLLITDHIAVKDISSSINQNLIEEKLKTTIEFYSKYFFEIEEVVISGINPHVGENGLLGTEDLTISLALNNSKSLFPKIQFNGPFSGDTLHMHKNESKKQLFAYMYHDQGLAPFKSHHGLIGLNVTMGLPFLRLSVDHGTAFDLYGKNKANITGMLFLLKEAMGVSQYVDKRN